MELHHSEKAANTPVHEAAKGAEHALTKEAMSEYHVCKDGRVVTDPKDCHTQNLLPSVQISHST